MTLFLHLFRQFRLGVLLATLAGMISGVSAAGMAIVISLSLQANHPTIWLGAIFFLCCAVFLIAKSYSETRLIALNQMSMLHLRLALGHRILATPQKKLQAIGRQPLLTILTKDIESFALAFQFMPITISNSLLVIACFGYLFWLSSQFFLLLALFLVAGAITFRLAEHKPLQRLAEAREQLDRLYIHLRNLIEGSRELQLNERRGRLFVEAVIATDGAAVKDSYTSGLSTYTYITNVGNLLFYLVIGVFIFLVPIIFPQDRAVLISIVLILLYLIKPISELMITLPVLRQASIALARIEQLGRNLDQSALPAPAQSAFARSAPLQLRLDGVRHSYRGDMEDNGFMLGPMDLTINQGEIVMIVGGNGSGKTTLAMVMIGLYEAEEGRLFLNDVPVTPVNLSDYRQYFSVVFSDFHLFEQVLDAESDESREMAMGYLRALQLSHKVSIKDGRFSTLDLSSGQRKRLALVSSYLEDRPIYLFDEWAADQDPAFKNIFYKKLLPELKRKGKTVIAITHDDAYFDCADRIIKLADGKLAPITPQSVAAP